MPPTDVPIIQDLDPGMHHYIRIASKALIKIAAGVGVGVGGLWLVVAQPTWHRTPPSELTVDPVRLRQHVTSLARPMPPATGTAAAT